MKKTLKALVSFLFAAVILFSLHQALSVDSSAAAALSTPTITSCKDLSGCVKLEWQDDSRATKTYIYRKASGADKYVCIGSTSSDTYKDTTAKTNVKYTYYIKSFAVLSKQNVYSKNSAAKTLFKYKPGKTTSLKASNKDKTNYVLLTWQSVPGADGYYIYKSTKKSGPFTKTATVSGNSYADKSVNNFSTYYYKVCAYNKEDGSTYTGTASSVVCVATKKALSTPVIKSIKAKSVKNVIEWTDDNKSTKTLVYRKEYGEEKFKYIGSSTTNSYTDTKISTGKKYVYYIKSYVKYSDKEYYSKNSKSLNITNYYPAAVTGLKATNQNKTNYVKLTWNKASNAKGYYVYRATSKTGTYTKIATTKNTSYEDKTVKNFTTYYYKICSYNTSGESTFKAPACNAVKVSTVKALSTPKITSQKASASGITLKWTQDSKAKQTYIYRKVSGEDKYTRIGTSDTSSYTDTTAVTSVKYVYYIKSSATYSDKTYYSSKSSAVSAISYYPAKVKNVSVSTQNKEQFAYISWSKQSKATGYEIYTSSSKTGTYTKVAQVTTTSYNHENLVGEKKYFYKVRAYKTVNGKKYYGKFSDIKSVKTLSWEVIGATVTPLSGTSGVALSEQYTCLFDQNVDTKWCVNAENSFPTVIWKYSEPVKPTGYTMITANDNSIFKGRNPQKWALYAANVSSDAELASAKWTLLSYVEDDTTLEDTNYKPYDFEVDDLGKKFQYYKLVVYSTKGNAALQLSELAIIYPGCDYKFNLKDAASSKEPTGSYTITTGTTYITNGGTYYIREGDTVTFRHPRQPISSLYAYNWYPVGGNDSCVSISRNGPSCTFTAKEKGCVEFEGVLTYSVVETYQTYTYVYKFTVWVVDKNAQSGSSSSDSSSSGNSSSGGSGYISTPQTCNNCGGAGRVKCINCTNGYYYDSINNETRKCVALRCENGYKDCLYC